MTKQSAKEAALQAAQEKLASIIAKNMPPEILDNAITEVAKSAIIQFNVNNWDIQTLLRGVVEERTKELLKTKYKKEIEELAEKAANIALGSMGRGR